MNKKISSEIKSLPQKPGVYLFKEAGGRILYIGKAIKLKNRVRSHFSKTGNTHRGELIEKISDIDFIKTAGEKEALILEDQLIKRYKPRYNVQWRDDKSYLWASFSDDEWPKVQVAHRKSPIANGRSETSQHAISHMPLAISQPIGPLTNGKELKQVLRALRKILPYRTCKNAYDKPCLQWHLGLCPAHGENPSQLSFKKEGGAAFLQKTVRMDLKNYHSSLNTYYESLNTLKQLLRLYANEPLRIEAYDISNIQGTSATGSMIVFKGFKPDKSQYRKFRIKTVRGANDVAMLQEVLRRRLAHSEWPMPDLMLIDGGRAQLNAANLAYSQRHIANGKFNSEPYAISHMPLAMISLAKKEEELYTIYSDRVLRLNKLPADLRLLFQAIRNEAHRFAITYYRKLHGKKFKRGTAPKNSRTKNQAPPEKEAP